MEECAMELSAVEECDVELTLLIAPESDTFAEFECVSDGGVFEELREIDIKPATAPISSKTARTTPAAERIIAFLMSEFRLVLTNG